MKAGKSDCHMHTRAAGDVEVMRTYQLPAIDLKGISRH
jgi:hypothetical protein